jgi:hypothetical protein
MVMAGMRRSRGFLRKKGNTRVGLGLAQSKPVDEQFLGVSPIREQVLVEMAGS